jgi:hypothetical protein
VSADEAPWTCLRRDHAGRTAGSAGQRRSSRTGRGQPCGSLRRRSPPEAALHHARGVLSHAGVLGVSHELLRWAWPQAARAAYYLPDTGATGELLALLDSYMPGHLGPVLRAGRAACSITPSISPACTRLMPPRSPPPRPATSRAACVASHCSTAQTPSSTPGPGCRPNDRATTDPDELRNRGRGRAARNRQGRKATPAPGWAAAFEGDAVFAAPAQGRHGDRLTRGGDKRGDDGQPRLGTPRPFRTRNT